jgi:hypothetical protein
MTKYYIYPTYNPSRDKSGNLYIKYFRDAFIYKGHTLKNRFGKFGIVSCLLNLDAEVFIFHWIDLIPFKRYGKLQLIVFFPTIILLRCLGKKIIWFLHNKRSHTKYSCIVDKCMIFMAIFANKVVVHSKTDGLSFYNQNYGKYGCKAYYIPHPVYNNIIYISNKNSIQWEYIIWGNISKHKSILEFILFTKSSDFFKNKQILICGQCLDLEYDQLITENLPSYIDYYNYFLKESDLIKLILKSRCILFTYQSPSVLSSGALIYSLNFDNIIIGPKIGNFYDLYFKGIIDCYKSFKDIEHINIYNKNNIHYKKDYIRKNTWSSLPSKIDSL